MTLGCLVRTIKSDMKGKMFCFFLFSYFCVRPQMAWLGSGQLIFPTTLRRGAIRKLTCLPRDMNPRVSSRGAPDWDLLDPLPTELQRRGLERKNGNAH